MEDYYQPYNFGDPSRTFDDSYSQQRMSERPSNFGYSTPYDQQFSSNSVYGNQNYSTPVAPSAAGAPPQGSWMGNNTGKNLGYAQAGIGILAGAAAANRGIYGNQNQANLGRDISRYQEGRGSQGGAYDYKAEKAYYDALGRENESKDVAGNQAETAALGAITYANPVIGALGTASVMGGDALDSTDTTAGYVAGSIISPDAFRVAPESFNLFKEGETGRGIANIFSAGVSEKVKARDAQRDKEEGLKMREKHRIKEQEYFQDVRKQQDSDQRFAKFFSPKNTNVYNLNYSNII